ncbi:MAG: hypothetical protein BWZ07_03359 [Alphaproteobacteria bacterium ADurb.BinA280]|nr:MAG: hypothetical protein BWZ07_03359 [Alphaproteobacteria bacterium ADurb.BinA280]
MLEFGVVCVATNQGAQQILRTPGGFGLFAGKQCVGIGKNNGTVARVVGVQTLVGRKRTVLLAGLVLRMGQPEHEGQVVREVLGQLLELGDRGSRLTRSNQSQGMTVPIGHGRPCFPFQFIGVVAEY